VAFFEQLFYYLLLLFEEGSSGHKVSYAYFVAFFEQVFYLLLQFAEGSSGHKVSYAYFVAFISLLRNMELIKKVYLNATNGSRTAELTKVCLTTVLALFLSKRL
jgi:hypothetical protein